MFIYDIISNNLIVISSLSSMFFLRYIILNNKRNLVQSYLNKICSGGYKKNCINIIKLNHY